MEMESNREAICMSVRFVQMSLQRGEQKNAEISVQEALRLLPAEHCEKILEDAKYQTTAWYGKHYDKENYVQALSTIALVVSLIENYLESKDFNANIENETSNMKSQPNPTKEYTSDQSEVVNRIKKCQDYYEIFGVSKDVSQNGLKKSYHELALQCHPDKNHAPGATEAFKAIGNAFEVLSDPTKKRKYDYDLYVSNPNLYSFLNPLSQQRSERLRRYGFYEHNPYQADDERTVENIFNKTFVGDILNSQHRQNQNSTQGQSQTRYQRFENKMTSEDHSGNCFEDKQSQTKSSTQDHFQRHSRYNTRCDLTEFTEEDRSLRTRASKFMRNLFKL